MYFEGNNSIVSVSTSSKNSKVLSLPAQKASNGGQYVPGGTVKGPPVHEYSG